jgi:hypothetical protein
VSHQELVGFPPPRDVPDRRVSIGPSTGDDDALERAVLWHAAFHRFFGGQYDREKVPGDVRPLTCGEASKALTNLARKRPEPARHCLAQMLASGYVPDAHNAASFTKLAQSIMGKRARSGPEAIALLRARGLRQCGAEPALVGGNYANGTLQVPPGARRSESIVKPTEIKFRDGVFTVSTEVLVPRPFAAVRKLIMPHGWKKLGPFWVDVEERWNDWEQNIREGMVFEHFVVNWNTIVAQDYSVLLKANQRSKPGMIRTTYSLVCEEKGQILVDEGYVLAERIPGHRSWTRYVGVKTLKFASSFLNLLSPAVMAMYLETQAAGLHKLIRSGKRRSVKRATRKGG